MRVVDNNELLARKKESNKRNIIWGIKKCKFNNGLISQISLGSTARSSQVNLVWGDDLLSESNAGKYTLE